jgi:hypothetical protein
VIAQFVIKPLASEHDRLAFCGVDALDRYLQNRACQEERRHISNCFVAPPAKGASSLSLVCIADTKEHAAIAIGPPAYAFRKLVAGDLNLRSQVIDFVGSDGSVLKTKTRQSIQIAGFWYQSWLRGGATTDTDIR